MINKIYLTLLLCLLSFRSIEQASIVYDPTNGAQIANVLSTMKELKEVNEQWKANTEFLGKIMNEGKEVKRLISLLEGILCATDELSIFIGLSSSMDLCENKLKMDIALAKIEGVSEGLKNIATGAILLSQYEAISSLKDLNQELEEAINATTSLNAMLRHNFFESLKEEEVAEMGEKEMKILTNFNL